MQKTYQIIFSLVFALSLHSIAFSDVTNTVASFVGRNIEGYLPPFEIMMGTDMNSGYYCKVSPYNILGMDLTFDFAYAIAPADQTTYNLVIPNDKLISDRMRILFVDVYVDYNMGASNAINAGLGFTIR